MPADIALSFPPHAADRFFARDVLDALRPIARHPPKPFVATRRYRMAREIEAIFVAVSEQMFPHLVRFPGGWAVFGHSAAEERNIGSSFVERMQEEIEKQKTRYREAPAMLRALDAAAFLAGHAADIRSALREHFTAQQVEDLRSGYFSDFGRDDPLPRDEGTRPHRRAIQKAPSAHC